MRLSFSPFGLLLLTNSLFAADGVLEINQACALNGGCFAGDSAGFPVTIDGSAGVSYRLTGSLDLSAVPDTTAIDIDAPYITLDLNGFEIAGPITCTGTGGGIDCGALGNGDGIALSSNADYVSVHNGTIRNMSRHGVGALGNQLRVRDVTARNNARDGLNGGVDSIAVNCIANQNGNDGFQFGSGSVIDNSVAFGNGADGIRIEASNGVIDNSTARNNGGQGFEMGHSSRFGRNSSTGNAMVDSCGGGLCTDRKKIYLTTTSHDGANVLDACANGFHTASLPEIWEFSRWQYDYVLGDTLPDSGRGIPVGRGGWIRTGSTDDPAANCDAWTSNNAEDDGTSVFLPIPQLWDTAADDVSPWSVDDLLTTCSFPRPVWCAED